MRLLLASYHYLLAPVLFVLSNYFFVCFIPFVKKRRHFERENLTGPEYQSFHKEKQIADVCFEVSSEGELEQVLPIIHALLDHQKRVELIYCSPSVKDHCLKIFQANSGHVRLLRLPLVTYFPFFGWGQSVKSWMTAKTLVLCRYDFFPELLALGNDPKNKFILVNATLKNKNSFFMRPILSLFDQVVCASQNDELKMKALLKEEVVTNTFDFRVIQIRKRLKDYQRKNFFQSTSFQAGRELINLFPKEKTILFGSMWPLELAVFDCPDFLESIKKREQLVVIAPHRLEPQALDQFTHFFDQLPGQMDYQIWDEHFSQENVVSFKNKPGILILTVRGILCEMYQWFGHAYVGGGHGKSVHSLLEPFLAGVQVYCGPKTHRSTEYDFILGQAPQGILLVPRLNEFYKILQAGHCQLPMDRSVEMGSDGNDFFKHFVQNLVEVRT